MVLQVETPCSPCQKDRCEKTWCGDFLDVEAVKSAAEMMLFDAKAPIPDFPDLSVYRSRFLSNGTLIYAPVTEMISERYQAGFIHRTLWESALGLDLDQEFADEMGAKLLPLAPFRSKIEALRSKYAFISSRYPDGLNVLHEAALAGRAGLLPEQGGSSVMETLRGIDAEIVSRGESILRTFHGYEMMDGDWTNPLEAARRLSEKYAKLHGMAQGFSRLLEPDGQGRTSVKAGG